MAPATVSCPYCNAYVTIPHPLPADRRLFCSRCGEKFLYQGPLPDSAEPAPPDLPLATPNGESGTAPTPRTSTARANFALATLLLGVMITMALFSLTIYLRTVQIRRDHDVQLP